MEVSPGTARCGPATARAVDGRLVLDGADPVTTDGRVAATWAAAHVAWQAQDAGQPLDLTAALPTLATPAS